MVVAVVTNNMKLFNQFLCTIHEDTKSFYYKITTRDNVRGMTFTSPIIYLRDCFDIKNLDALISEIKMRTNYEHTYKDI